MLVGIALHKAMDRGHMAYHWILVIHPETYDAPIVRTYEMINRDDEGRATAWTTRFGECPLYASRQLVGVVHVGKVNVSEHHLDEFFRGFGSDRDEYPTGGRGWTSVGWVLRCIRYLEMSDLLPLNSTDDEIFTRVLQLGALMEEMRLTGQGSPVLKLNL